MTDVTVLDLIANELLTHLEKKENELLEWGIHGGYLQGLEEMIAPLFADPPTPRLQELIQQCQDTIRPHELIKNMVDRRMLFELDRGKYRTRYAEVMRLLFLLKQRFKEEDWQYAPNLVSNIKPILEYRRYPRRDQQLREWSAVFAEVADPQELRVLHRLLDGGKMKISRFQSDSILHLLKHAQDRYDHGTVIGAGTGAGKTKAFYLPAFAKTVSSIKEDSRNWTRVIGLYPRVELLKDQYREALKEIQNLNDLCDQEGIRKVTIGSYYGDTPITAQDVVYHKNRKWKKVDLGYISPFFQCPHCESSMVWTHEDHRRALEHHDNERSFEFERLTCVSCKMVISSENIVLTRNRMQKQPPDLLFTTTEMLNRKLTHTWERKLFGLDGKKRPPLYLLLDEVHIYNGISGAHVAYLLRRWRHLVSQQYRRNYAVQYVGLSATLSNPESFFAQMTGVRSSAITSIMPKEQDLVEEGVEYNLVLRGDPFSATALLSTSVQTAMLIGRMLDPLGKEVSAGAFGSKVFGFTDKLDVINRWYHIEIDAEKRRGLSKFRDESLLSPTNQKTMNAQFQAGQIWALAKRIDPYSLRKPLGIDLASSQNRGVDETAKLVIATSTLEVGYNDPAVGAVIQHKAPRNLASFLQRKGRAGRTRAMRPWTLVVTSAYGRDRYVYDYPELLFKPVLDDLHLPLGNVYVQRIQAALAFMDWLTEKMVQAKKYGDVRYLLTFQPSKQEMQEWLLQVIREVLQGEDEEFKDYLAQALTLTSAEVDELLWSFPRPLFFEVLPTVYHLLETNFADARSDEKSYPLTGFIPRALFRSLEVSDLEIEAPNGKVEWMSLVQGMIEYAPGNVSKRYVNAEYTKEAHWLPVLHDGAFDLAKSGVESRPIGEVEHEGVMLQVRKPFKLILSQIPDDISDRSRGFLQWEALIESKVLAEETDRFVKVGSGLQKLLPRVRTYLSEEQSYVRILRYSPATAANLKWRNGASDDRTVFFQTESGPTALGFDLYPDALCFSVRTPVFLQEISREDWDHLVRVSRPDFYQSCLLEEPEITGSLNVFQIQWLSNVVLASVTAIAVSQQVDFVEAMKIYRAQRVPISKRTLEVIFHSTVVNKQTDDEYADESGQDESKVFSELVQMLENDQIMEPFLAHLRVLHEDLSKDDRFLSWLQGTHVTTTAALIQKAIADLLPDVNTEDLTLDVQKDQIWLSENESGGVGIISKVVAMLRNDPASFEASFLSNIESCPRHRITSSLRNLLPKFTEEPFATLLQDMREENQLDRQKQFLEELKMQLDAVGVSPRRDLVTSISQRVVRKTYHHEHDKMMLELHQLWQQEEERLHCSIDSHTFAVVWVKRGNIGERLRDLLPPQTVVQEKQKFLLVESLLLSDCEDSCPECLQLYSPFQRFQKPSRLLMQSLLQKPYVEIHYGQLSWQERVKELLFQGRRVRLVLSTEERKALQGDLLALVHTPLEFKYELYYPYMERVAQEGGVWKIDLKVREVSHE